MSSLLCILLMSRSAESAQGACSGRNVTALGGVMMAYPAGRKGGGVLGPDNWPEVC